MGGRIRCGLRWRLQAQPEQMLKYLNFLKDRRRKQAERAGSMFFTDVNDELENDFGLRLDWGSRPLRGASGLGDDRGCSRWPCFRALLDRRSLPSLCVLAGAVGPPCLMFGSLVRWMLAALHSCLLLMVDLCA